MQVHVSHVVAAPVVFNSLQDAIRDFLAVSIHGAMSHAVPFAGSLAAVVTVAGIYLVSSFTHLEEEKFYHRLR